MQVGKSLTTLKAEDVGELRKSKYWKALNGVLGDMVGIGIKQTHNNKRLSRDTKMVPQNEGI